MKENRPNQIQTILKNPLYYGVFRYNEEVYEGTPGNNFVFRAFMRCGKCGRMITAELQKGHTYYRCTKRLTSCSQKYIREKELLKQIKGIFQKV